MDSNLTAASELHSTLHDRERREERGIEKVTLQEARRYGMREPQGKGVVKYFYAGHVFVYNEDTNKSITSYKFDRIKDLYHHSKKKNPGGSSNNNNSSSKPRPPDKPIKSGTRFTKPILVEKSKDHLNAGVLASHDVLARQVQNRPSLWTSHTVMIVDMSGSMREDDINGARCRADGVWTTLARNFCRSQLEDCVTSVYDVVSVIVMHEEAHLVVECEPLTWVLYNKLVDFREWENMKPYGPGCYKPALQLAEQIFNLNHHGSCALSLMFFSDGKPSDFFQQDRQFDHKEYKKVSKDLTQTTGNLAARFGRRLTVTCVGMADTDEAFTTLKRMVDEAKRFGVQASFHLPSLNTDSLSQIISSSVTSSLISKTELTSLKTGKMRSVRIDVLREKQNAPDDDKPNSNWRVFTDANSKCRVEAVWTWSDSLYDFASIIDPRCDRCKTPVADANYNILSKKKVKLGQRCSQCNACFFCTRCIQVGVMRSHRQESCSEYLHDRRSGKMIGKGICPRTFNVAWKKKAFGEGAERLAFKFRFVNSKGNKFEGPVMVAKESRFVDDLDGSAGNYLLSHKHSYHKTFMRTQSIASQFATLFNQKIEQLLSVPVLVNVPEIEFVKPYIFELVDNRAKATYNVLVEPMIQGEYQKFTTNHGGVTTDVERDFFKENQGVDTVAASILLGRKIPPRGASGPVAIENHRGRADNGALNNGLLGIVEEGDEDEEDDSDEDDEEDSDEDDSDEEHESHPDPPSETQFVPSHVPATDYLQAFSHFSYHRSKGAFMVVDLQGCFGSKDKPRPTFTLTDPAIHQRSGKYRGKKRQFGRTDLGVKGMRAFFDSHVCNDVCRLLQLWRREKPKGTPAGVDT